MVRLVCECGKPNSQEYKKKVYKFFFFFFNDYVEDLTEVVGNRIWHLTLACAMCHRASMISTIVTIRQLTLNMCHKADFSTRSVSS